MRGVISRICNLNDVSTKSRSLLLLVGIAGITFGQDAANHEENRERFTDVKLSVVLSISYNCLEDEVCVDLDVINTLDRAVCLRTAFFPEYKRYALDNFEITTTSGKVIEYALPADPPFSSHDYGQYNLVVAPGKQSSTTIELSHSYHLNEKEKYIVEYTALAVFCDLYNRGNPYELYGDDMKFARAHSVILQSNTLEIEVL